MTPLESGTARLRGLISKALVEIPGFSDLGEVRGGVPVSGNPFQGLLDPCRLHPLTNLCKACHARSFRGKAV